MGLRVPIADVTLLLLLILFFWAQQKSRPQVYFRYWIVGWVAVLLSYLVWMLPLGQPVLGRIQDALRFDFLLLGTLTFLASRLDYGQKLWSKIQIVSVVALPALLMLDAQIFSLTPRLALFAGVVLWHGTAYWAALRLPGAARLHGRRVAAAVCLVCGAGMSVYVWYSSHLDLEALVLAEVLLLTAVMYRARSRGHGLSAGVGSVGFILWAAAYLLGYFPLPSSHVLTFVGLFWNFPKYFVGFSMILWVFEDSSNEQTRLAEQYRILYEDFRFMFESHVHPMWICEPESHRFLSANTAAILQYGYSEADFKEMTLQDLLEDGAFGENDDGRGEGIDSDGEGSDGEDEAATLLQHRRKDGSLFWVQITTSWVGFQGRDARFIMARDVTAEKLQNDELFYRANHDMLTGLPNRAMLDDRIRQGEMRCRLDGSRMIVITIDVDHFKRVNDAFGHLVGDECLKAVASRLNYGIRDVDMLARTGGEEFMAVIAGIRSTDDVAKVAAGILQKFESPLQLAQHTLTVTVSLGVAVYPDDGTSLAVLSQLSDEALYAAKRAGRNRAAFADRKTLEVAGS